MFLFFFINIILLLFSYFFYFSTYDMVRLASIERYISEYFLGWLIFVLYEIDTINILPTIKHNNSSLFIMLSLIIVLFFGFLTNNNFKIPPTSFTNQRLQIQNELKNIDTILSKDQIRKKVFIIDLKDNSDRHQIFRYELCPNLVQMWGWSVRINPDNNYFTIIKSPNEFLNEMIQNFDFILVWNADDLFYKEYGNLFNDFSITEPNIFQVTKTGFIKLN